MWPVREAGSSPPSTAKVRTEYNYTSHLSTCLHSADRDNLTSPPTKLFSQTRKPTLSTVCLQTDFDGRNWAFHNTITSFWRKKSHILNGVTLLTYCFPVSNSRSDNRRLPSCRSTNKSVIGGWEVCEQIFILINNNFNQISTLLMIINPCILIQLWK